MFWATSSRSNTFTWSFTFAGFMSLAMFSSGSGFTFLAFALTPLWSSFPSQFCQLPFARCFSFGPLHFPIIFSAKSPILLLFAWSMLSFLPLAFSLFTPWLLFTWFIFSSKVHFERSPSQSFFLQFIVLKLFLESWRWTCDWLQLKDGPNGKFKLFLSNCHHLNTHHCFSPHPKA